MAIVRIEQQGGMLPQWETLRWYPSTVVLYDDGRLIIQGPQIEIYPGPALPNLQVTHFTRPASSRSSPGQKKPASTGPTASSARSASTLASTFSRS